MKKAKRIILKNLFLWSEMVQCIAVISERRCLRSVLCGGKPIFEKCSSSLVKPMSTKLNFFIFMLENFNDGRIK